MPPFLYSVPLGATLNQDFSRHFQKLELFRDLSPTDLNKFLDESREEIFPPAQVIFEEGAQPDRFYVVLEGQVEIWKDYGTPYADILAMHGPGACFGEMSLIDELPRSATVKTATEARLLSLDKPRFRSIITENPSIALLIMRTVSKMVRASNDAFQVGLRQKNVMLETAYEDLKRVQGDLIRNERLSTLGKFASMIIHDLRNPISIVMGYGEMLALPSQSPERTAVMVQKLLDQVERLNRMVGELLDYSRGNIRLSLSPLYLGDLFAKLGDHYTSQLKSKEIELRVDNQVTEPLLVDQDRLMRVFSNLIDNARKAMRLGGILGLKAFEQEGEVVVRISDTGEGMPEEVVKNLFEPFFSASSSGGTGLGMVVVANVIEAHQGSVSVSSVPGKGTTIELKLPLHMQSLE